jgi:hypothetical protein
MGRGSLPWHVPERAAVRLHFEMQLKGFCTSMFFRTAGGCAWRDRGGHHMATETADSQDSGTIYSITFQNQSGSDLDFLMFQQPPPGPDFGALAWFAKPIPPGGNSKFEWRRTYEFVWGETGHLSPGVAFRAAQTVGADLKYTNAIELTRQGSAIVFTNAKSEQPAHGFNISVSSLVPANMVSVGLGMAGRPFFVRQALPNLRYQFMVDPPVYWIAAGSFQEGEVLDVEAIDKVQVKFEPNIFNVTATYDADGSWKLKNDLG